MAEKLTRKFFRMLLDERGNQNVKSAVGILFFFIFVGGGALLNSSALPLSYNIAFGDSGGNSGSGGGGGGGGYSYSPKTKARIDYLRLTVHYDNGENQTRSLGSVSNDVTVGTTGWIFPENVSGEDGNRSAAEMYFGESSYYLYANRFGFAIPKTARIFGITLDVKRSAEGPNVIKDYSVRLMAGGALIGVEYAKEDSWPAQDEFNTYGSAHETWAANITPDDINNKSFGIVIAARNGGTSLHQSAQSVTQQTVIIPATNQSTSVISQSKTDIEFLIQIAEKEKRGKNVILLQNALIAALQGPAANELASAGSTGYYGPVTKRAAAEWRNANGTQASSQNISVAKTPITTINVLDQIRGIKTPLIYKNKGADVTTLQKIIIAWNAGPEAQAVGKIGATGFYGWRTERAVAELQDVIINAVKGPEAWKLANALLKYAKGSWGELTKAAAIEYLVNLR